MNFKVALYLDADGPPKKSKPAAFPVPKAVLSGSTLEEAGVFTALYQTLFPTNDNDADSINVLEKIDVGML